MSGIGMKMVFAMKKTLSQIVLLIIQMNVAFVVVMVQVVVAIPAPNILQSLSVMWMVVLGIQLPVNVILCRILLNVIHFLKTNAKCIRSAFGI